MNSPNIWDDHDKAKTLIDETNELKNRVNQIIKIKENLDNLKIMCNESLDSELISLLESELNQIKADIPKLEFDVLFNDDYDNCNCILEIHSGAGGTEACDWADMLFRMYIRFCDKKNFKYEILDTQDGDQVGIKSATILIKGMNAYGYLKSEKGVHRLVRLSPFDSNNKRHTSFASVDVIPEFNENIEIEIKDSELKIDVYRSGGAGGQSVNTTDSAVRITHLPSKIVVTCQNERSQLKNKERAIQTLKNKLKMIEIDNNKQKLNDLKKDNKNIEFGSQIRSYVMHPYSMVKDHRTNIETSNVNKVLDGDIDLFIEGYLRRV